MPSTLETKSMTSEVNGMTISPLAGKLAPKQIEHFLLIGIAASATSSLSATYP
jgi:hypothetical protein